MCGWWWWRWWFVGGVGVDVDVVCGLRWRKVSRGLRWRKSSSPISANETARQCSLRLQVEQHRLDLEIYSAAQGQNPRLRDEIRRPRGRKFHLKSAPARCSAMLPSAQGSASITAPTTAPPQPRGLRSVSSSRRSPPARGGQHQQAPADCAAGDCGSDSAAVTAEPALSAGAAHGHLQAVHHPRGGGGPP